MTQSEPTPLRANALSHRPRRPARIGALLLAASIGLAGPVLAQGSGPRDGGPRDGTPAGQGWHDRMHDGWRGSWHGSEHRPRHGGMMFGPGSVERMVERLARATDASSEQKQKMNAIAQAAAVDVLALRQRHRAGREQLRGLLTAPSIDRARLEALRVEQMKLADEASKRITAAIADIAEILTPPQREELGRMLERRFGSRL